jgi:hypothetical protein
MINIYNLHIVFWCPPNVAQISLSTYINYTPYTFWPRVDLIIHSLSLSQYLDTDTCQVVITQWMFVTTYVLLSCGIACIAIYIVRGVWLGLIKTRA